MSTKKDLGQASNGLYFRNLGWKQTPSGCTQQKFYLGRDESKAKLANMRLEQLWQQIVRRWERDIGPPPANEKDRPGPKVVELGREPVFGQVQLMAPMANASNDQEQAAIGHRWSALAAAKEIAEQDGPKRWELESRVLANQPVETISARCGLSPDIIVAYETWFFDVRTRLGAGMWITNMVIGDGIQRRFLNHEVGPFWAAYGYHGGPFVVDALVDAFHAARRPDEPLTLSVYLRPDSGTDPGIQANVASLVLPHYGPAAKAWQWVHIQLMESDATDDQDRRTLLRERARDWLIRCARSYLAGKPLPRPRRQRQTPKDRQTSKTDKPGSGTQRTSMETMLMEPIGSGLDQHPS